MTQMYTCPAEGCDYEGVKNSVASHYSGKTDEDHRGGYERAQTMIEDQGPDDQVEEESGDDGSDTGGSSPGDGLQFPENPDADEGGCPDCGGRMDLAPGGVKFTTEDGRTGVTEGDELYCSDCGVLVEDGGDGKVVR